MRPTEQIEELIYKVLRGKADRQELKRLNDWYDQQDDQETIVSDRKGRSKKKVKRNLYAGIHVRLKKEETYPSITKPQRRSSWYVAAALVAGIMLAAVLYGEMTPTNDGDDSVSYHVAENGIGMKKKVRLPDGSLVHLFHDTRIEFHPDFSVNRHVVLHGTAFFEVEKDSLHPFRISSSALDTEVLGTSFMISTDDTGLEKVAVKTGTVRVTDASDESFTLGVNQQLKHTQGASSVEDIKNPEQLFGWVSGTITFDHTEIKDMVVILERWYGIQITYDSPPDFACKISGSYQNLSLEDLLQAIQYSIPFTFNLTDKHVDIQFSPCQ